MTVVPGPPRSPEDVAESVAAIEETFTALPIGDVVVVDGRGCSVHVERGRLHIIDGLGPFRRERSWDKATADLRRVVVMNADTVVSTAALRWCHGIGVAVVVLGADGGILAAGPPGRDDARLLRAQALALYGSTGVEITRYLIGAKLRGQARVLGLRLGEDDGASTLVGLLEAVESADSIESVRQIEASGANVAFAAWERGVEVIFVRRDLPRTPEHWRRFNGRRSLVNPGSPRSATDPCGAMLNLGYKLAEVEATLAIRRMGLSESLGILHADIPGRPSFSCDIQEAVRPLVDEHILGLCAGPLRKRDFTEDHRGVVRVLAPMSHRLAEAMPSYAHALGPVVEHVAGLLAASSPYGVRVPTVLSGAKHKAAARRRVAAEHEGAQAERREPVPVRGPGVPGLAPRGRRRIKPSAVPPLPVAICRGCGGTLAVESHHGYAHPRTDWCPSCLPERREEIGTAIHTASLDHAQHFAEATGTLPTHTADAQAARSDANRRQREEEVAFAMSFAAGVGANWYTEHVAPKLATFTLPAIARATGASTSAASKWRAGRRLPHVRHWAALAQLAGVQFELDDPLVAFGVVEDHAMPVTNVGVEVALRPTPDTTSRQQQAIAHTRREQAAQRAELIAQVDAAVAEVGWSAARPVVVSVLGPGVPVSGARGRWRHLLRKRNGGRLLADLAALPVQERLRFGES